MLSSQCIAARLWQFPLDEELVIARPDVQGLFLLNGTARFVWDQFARGADLPGIIRNCVARYGVSEAVATRDVESTFIDWSQGLLSSETGNRPTIEPPPRLLESNRDFVEINCVLNGRGFRVLLEPGDLVEELAPRLAPVSVTHLVPNAPVITFVLANGEDQVFLFRDGTCIGAEEKTSGARAVLLQEMTSHCVPNRETKVILHAGACGTASHCVILAGTSHAGKSTLCAALMAGGLNCYSDDSAILDREFKLSGMPFPLMLRESSWPILDSRFPSLTAQAPTIHRWGHSVRFLPSNLPADSSPSVKPTALVFVDYRPGASTTLEPLMHFEALMALQQAGFWVEHDRETIAGFLGWVGGLRSYRLTYSLLEEASDAVAGLLT